MINFIDFLNAIDTGKTVLNIANALIYGSSNYGASMETSERLRLSGNASALPTLGSNAAIAIISIAPMSNATFSNIGSAYTGAAIAAPASNANPFVFTTTYGISVRILSQQCARFSSFLEKKLSEVDPTDDEHSEDIVEELASVADILGEPAYYTLQLETSIHKDDLLSLEKILLAVGSAKHKESAEQRLKLLKKFAADANPRKRRSALRAISRMDTAEARRAFLEWEAKGRIRSLPTDMSLT